MKRSTGISALVLATVALVSCLLAAGCAGQTGSADNAITVSADATCEIVPDTAALTVTVAGSGDTAEAAADAARSAGNDVVAQLKLLGVDEGQMSVKKPETTERFGEVTLVQDRVGGYEDEWGNWIDEFVNEYYVDQTGQVVGYDATCKVRVNEFAADALGQVAREAAAAGATEFSNLSFTVSDHEGAYQQALTQAVDAAHAKAESLAKASGVYVGRLVNLYEGSSSEFEDTVKDESATLKAGDESTYDIEPTPVPVFASVTASYAIS